MDENFLMEFIKTEAEVELEKAKDFLELSDLCEIKGDFEKGGDYIILAKVAVIKARALKDEYIRMVKERLGEAERN